MSENDDNDVGATSGAPALEDSASVSGDIGNIYDIVKTKTLTIAESTSVGVVQMLKINLTECRSRLSRLEKMETEYNKLRVEHARLDAKVKVCGKADVFWDLVLIISPLCIGLFINRENIVSLQGLLIGVPLLIFIVAALIARYTLPKSK